MRTSPNPLRSLATAIFFAPMLLLAGCRLLKADPHVVLLGDSITQGWSYPSVNLGIHGNTTAQMLERFPRQVPGHGYSTVIVLGGTNDLLLDVPPETTIHNLEELGGEITRQNAQPVLCEIPPIFHDYQPEDSTNFDPRVRDLNRRIRDLAAQHHWQLVDFYTPLAGHPNLSSDGVHMKRSGYLTMERALLGHKP